MFSNVLSSCLRCVAFSKASCSCLVRSCFLRQRSCLYRLQHRQVVSSCRQRKLLRHRGIGCCCFMFSMNRINNRDLRPILNKRFNNQSCQYIYDMMFHASMSLYYAHTVLYVEGAVRDSTVVLTMSDKRLIVSESPRNTYF